MRAQLLRFDHMGQEQDPLTVEVLAVTNCYVITTYPSAERIAEDPVELVFSAETGEQRSPIGYARHHLITPQSLARVVRKGAGARAC